MTQRIRARLSLAMVLFTLFVLISVLAGTAPVARAATITVNSTGGDATGADGNCTLREAINNAESDSDTTGGDCLAGSGADIIDLGFSLTYTLDEVDNINSGGNGLPLITTDITINGNGSTVERSGVLTTPQFRIFSVASSGILVLNALTVTNGDASTSSGGGIRSDGTLTLATSNVDGNTSARSGGGINNSGSGILTLSNSSVTNNTAGDGGGDINNSGQLTLNTTTISNNAAARWGGGIHNVGSNVSAFTDQP